MPDGRWFDVWTKTWRNGRERPARWPDLQAVSAMPDSRVALAAAHLDHDPRHNSLRDLKILCQRCYLIHDQATHLVQRRITYRLRYALGDLFPGIFRRSPMLVRAG